MTILKIRNPVLRLIAGLLTLVAVVAAIAGICYGVGRLTMPSCGENGFADYLFGGLVISLFTLVLGGAVIVLALITGDGLTRHVVTDFFAGLGIIAVLFGAIFGVIHLLGRLAVLLWPPLYLGPGFMDYVGSGCGVFAALGLLLVGLWAAYSVGEKYYDP